LSRGLVQGGVVFRRTIHFYIWCNEIDDVMRSEVLIPQIHSKHPLLLLPCVDFKLVSCSKLCGEVLIDS